MAYQSSQTFPAYTSVWQIPTFYDDITNKFGSYYLVDATDQISLVSGMTYSVNDYRDANYPARSGKDILTFANVPGGNPQIGQGRTLDISLPWTDTLSNSNNQWEIHQQGTLIAYSGMPSNPGWDVQTDYFNPYNALNIYYNPYYAWVTVPSTADTTKQGYEVICSNGAGGVGAGFFDVKANSNTIASVIKSVGLSANSIKGGSGSITVTITLDNGCRSTEGCMVSMSIVNGNSVATLQNPYVYIQGGQKVGTVTINTTTTSTSQQFTLLATYNGTRTATFTVTP